MMKRSIFSLCLLLFLSAMVFAHSRYVYDQDLSWDPALEEHVTQAAQSFLHLEEKPLHFDYDRELLVVQFNRSLELSVDVDPRDYSVRGFRNDSLIGDETTENLDAAGRKEKVMALVSTFASDVMAEMVYAGESKDYTGVYRHLWFRMKDGIVVLDDEAFVDISAESGKIVAWRYPIFFHPADEMDSTPAFNGHTAQLVAQLFTKGELLDAEPFLVFYQGKLAWIVKVKQLYPIYVAVDAHDGEVLFAGNIPALLPDGYGAGKEMKIVPNDFIKGLIS